MGIITGSADPLGAQLPGPDLVNPDLTNQRFNLEGPDRYTRMPQVPPFGSAEAVDHILTSANLNPFVRDIQVGRRNADTPWSSYLDLGTPLNASSRDGVVLFLSGEVDVLDVDGNSSSDALTDGLLALRYLYGFTGPALVDGAVGSNCTRCSDAEVEEPLDTHLDLLDLDGNNFRDALTDGLLILRYLFGFRGDALITGAVGFGATRTSAAEIEAYLAGM